MPFNDKMTLAMYKTVTISNLKFTLSLLMIFVLHAPAGAQDFKQKAQKLLNPVLVEKTVQVRDQQKVKSQQRHVLDGKPIGPRPVRNGFIEPQDPEYSSDHQPSGFQHADSIPNVSEINDERCGTEEVNEAIRKKYGTPSINEFEKWMKEEKQSIQSQGRSMPVITIPVVVHVIHNGEAVGSLPNISDAQIQSQIDVLNDDFRRMNADAVNTPDVFAGVVADVELEFCFATVDPEGNPTTGINRYNGNKVSYSKADLENIIKPNTIWHPEYYFNIWCAPLQGGLLGYAQFPSNSTLMGFNVNGGPSMTDGIVVRDYAFGVAGSATPPFDLGRIATHEAGHFFGLRHLGGDGGCAVDDFCNDTPTQSGQNGFFQSCDYNPLAVGPPLNDCDDGPGDLADQFMNYMDYVPDACMNMFTKDQKSRIDVVMSNSPRRASLANSQVCNGIPPDTTFVPFPYAPANDLCIDAEIINCNDTKTGNTIYSSPLDIPMECGTNPGGSGIWYKFAGDGGLNTLSLCNSQFNTRINVYSGDCDSVICVAGNDNGCGLQSTLSILTDVGTEYYIYISGFNGETGSYRLLRTCGASTGLGSSSNVFSSLLTRQNQVYASDSLDLVAFIHRQDISLFSGSNGVLRYDISTDGGMSFNNNVGVLNPLDTMAARYPQLTGMRTSTSTNPFDHKFVWTAPVFQDGMWQGIADGAADIVANSPVLSTENYDFTAESNFFGGGLCEGLPGEFWAFDQSYNGVGFDDSLYIQKGTYNPVSEDVEWVMHKWIQPNHYTGYDGTPRVIGCNISFSPDGTKGWAALLGDLAGGSDSTYNPIFIPTTDGGDTWAQPIEVDLRTIDFFGDLADSSSTLMEILQLGDSIATGRPTCAFEFDLTVDGDGNPHMLVVVGNATVEPTPDPSYVLYSVLRKVAVDIFSEDGGITWKAYQVAPISQFEFTIGTVGAMTMDNFMQISRTPDGTHVFYSWMDADTSGGIVVPNLRIAGRRMSDNFLTCPKWITLGGPLDGIGAYPTMSPEVLINDAGTGYNLPIVMSVLNASGSPLDPTQYLYLGNDAVIYDSDYLFDFETIDYSFCEPESTNPTDDFGYSYADCGENTFSWIDVTTKPGAVETMGLTDDSSIGPFPIGFDFKYYWLDQSHFKIGSNGWVGFDDATNIMFCFPTIPTPGGAADNYLAPLMVDLTFGETGNPGEVWYWSNEIDTLVISYLNVPFWSSDEAGFSGSNTFQVILSGQDSGITYQYLNVGDGFTNNELCDTELLIGIENSNGDVGIQASVEVLPDDSCSVKFNYPDSSSYVFIDAAVEWNQNVTSSVEIVDINAGFSLQSRVKNIGSRELEDLIVVGELVNNSIPASVYMVLDTIPSLEAAQSLTHIVNPDYMFNEPGNISFVVDLISNEDEISSNNSLTSELVVIDCMQETVKLDYNSSDILSFATGWGNQDRDLYGLAVLFDPPGIDFRLDSVELIVLKLESVDEQTITVKIIANDGPLGMGTLLFETDLLKEEYPSDVPFSVPVGELEIGENGFYVYWGGDENIFLNGSAEGPFSGATYEVVNGNWATYRSGDSREFHVRAYGSCMPYPFAPPNDLCANAQFINCLDTLDGNTAHASPFDTPGVCGTGPVGSGLWYRFIGDGNSATLSLSNVLFDAEINVYSGSCDALTCIDGTANGTGQTSSLDFMTTVGTNYYVYISGSLEDVGTFTLVRSGSCTPCPLGIAAEASSNSPICTGVDLNLSVVASGQEPFSYAWSGPGGVFINGNTATPLVSGAPSGIYTVTVTNGCGSEVVSSTNVQVNGPPEIAVSGPMLLPVDPGLCLATIDTTLLFALVTATGTPTPQITIPHDPQYPVGMSSITAEASNTCGITPATIDIFVIENVPPSALCKNIIIEVAEASIAIRGEDIDNGSSDACGIQPLLINGLDSIVLDGSTAGNYAVTLTVSDNYGNQSTCEAIVGVVNNLCINGNDLVDSDNGGLPDDCDCSPFDDFNDRIVLVEDVNTGMDFDGVDDHLTIQNAPAFNPSVNGSITFEAWVKPDMTKPFNTIISKGHGGGVPSTYIFSILDSTNVGLYMANSGGTGGLWFYADSVLSPNDWMHITASYNHTDSTISFYYNGNLVNEIQTPLVPYNGDINPVFIGQQGYQCECNHYKGQMEEVRVWSIARTESEIQSFLNKELRGFEHNLLAYYNFNEGIPDGDNTGLTIAEDRSPNGHDATLSGFAQTGSGSNWVHDSIALLVENKDTLDLCLTCTDTLSIGMAFDGVDDHVVIAHDSIFYPSVNSSFALEAWVNAAPGQVSQTILSKGNGSSASTSYIFSIYQNKLALFIGNGTLATWIYGDTDVTFNSWLHAAVSYDGDTDKFEFYLNGVSDGERTLPHGFFVDNSPVYIGRQGQVCNCNYFLGRMDEVRIWDEARIESQILGHMNKELYGGEEGLIGYYNFNNGVPNGNNTNLTILPDMSLYEHEGAVSGFTKTGTASNWVSAPIALTHPVNAALDFDGVDDYIRVPNDPGLIPTASNAVTYETWIYPVESMNGQGFLSSSGSFPDRNHQIFLTNNTKKISVGGTGVTVLVSNATVPNDAWTHVAVVFDMTETRLYINGKLDKTRVQTLEVNNLGFDVTFGHQESGSPSTWSFRGKMDDVRIWDYARSSDQILGSMYQEVSGIEAGLVAYYNLNNGVPDGDNSELISIEDITGNGNIGTLSGFTKMGSTSNWVASPFNFGDGDDDGTPDFCDNCFARKELVLDNSSVDGVYRALNQITLGEGITISSDANLIFRAPYVKVSEFISPPIGASILVTPLVCEE